MHLFYCINVIIKVYVSRPRENSIRDDVVVRAKRCEDCPENWKNPNKGEDSDKERNETIFTLLIVAVLLVLNHAHAHLRSSLKTTRK